MLLFESLMHDITLSSKSLEPMLNLPQTDLGSLGNTKR